MKFKVDDIVRIIDKDAFYYNAVGIIRFIASDDDYSYYIEFEAEDDETGEVFIYESNFYREDQIELI